MGSPCCTSILKLIRQIAAVLQAAELTGGRGKEQAFYCSQRFLHRRIKINRCHRATGSIFLKGEKNCSASCKVRKIHCKQLVFITQKKALAPSLHPEIHNRQAI